MTTTIATKTDLHLLRQELTFAMSALATGDKVQAIKDEIRELRQDNALVRNEMVMLSTQVTLRVSSIVGTIVVTGLGLLFAALKLT